MTRPLNEFGGWLRFFEACCWLSQAASVVIGPLLLWFLVSEKGLHARLENLSLLGDLAVRFHFVRLILRALRVPAAASAERIRGWLKAILLVALGFLAADLILALWKNGWSWGQDAARALSEGKSAVVWPALWLAYFLRAERVKAFYAGPEPSAAAAP